MFSNSKTENATLDRPATKHQKQEYHSFRYNGTLRHEQNLEDYSHGVEPVLERLNYHLLPGETSVMRTYYNGSDFIVTIVIGQVTSLIYCNSLDWYTVFCKEYGSRVSVWHLVAPFPRETKVDPSLYRTFDLRRGY